MVDEQESLVVSAASSPGQSTNSRLHILPQVQQLKANMGELFNISQTLHSSLNGPKMSLFTLINVGTPNTPKR